MAAVAMIAAQCAWPRPLEHAADAIVRRRIVGALLGALGKVGGDVHRIGRHGDVAPLGAPGRGRSTQYVNRAAMFSRCSRRARLCGGVPVRPAARL